MEGSEDKRLERSRVRLAANLKTSWTSWTSWTTYNCALRSGFELHFWVSPVLVPASQPGLE